MRDLEAALQKIQEGKKRVKGSKESVMKKAVAEALCCFCRQDAGFARAVVDGGAFDECMKAVAAGAGNALSDLEAYRKAVKFYFPEADVRFAMTIETGGAKADGTEAEAAAAQAVTEKRVIDLSDFL